MKLRITPRHLPSHPNYYRPTSSHALHSRHHPGLHLRSPHLPKRPIWLTHSQPPRKWSLILLLLHLLPHRPRNLLRLLLKQRNLKHRSYSTSNPHSNRLCRICITLRPNILLRRHSNHKPILSNPIHRSNTSRMSLRRLLSRQPNTNPILRPTLPPTLRHCRTHTSPPYLPARNRIQQPPRNPLRLRQNSIPPLLLYKRHPGLRTNAHPPRIYSPILPQPPRRPRKLHPSKPPIHPPSHQTRVILPICLRHPPLHPKQTRGSPSPSRLRPSPIPNPPTTHI